MKVLMKNAGFSIIELIVVAVIINILAGIAIVSYIGVQEKARVARVQRTASSSVSELQLWLQSSVSSKKNVRELDTNFDGVINGLDLNNSALLNNVANVYTNGRNTVLNETSPWFNRSLWNSDDPAANGTINLKQPISNQLKLVATEKNGRVIYEKVIFVN